MTPEGELGAVELLARMLLLASCGPECDSGTWYEMMRADEAVGQDESQLLSRLAANVLDSEARKVGYGCASTGEQLGSHPGGQRMPSCLHRGAVQLL